MSNPEQALYVEWHPYKRSFKRPFKTGLGDFFYREGIILRIKDGAGRVGYGEIAPWPFFGTETLSACVKWCEAFAKRWASVEDLFKSVRAKPCCSFALDMAMWMMALEEDALRRTVSIPLCGYLPAGDDVLPVLDDKLSEGFLSFKWKVGVASIDKEQTLFRHIWQKVHQSGGALRLDPNGVWTLAQALSWLSFLKDYPIDYIEQPLKEGQEGAMEALALRYKNVVLALDSSVRCVEAIRHFGSKFCVLVIKPAWLGGWGNLHQVLKNVSARVVYSSALETLVGAGGVLLRIGQSFDTVAPVGFGVDGIFDDDWNAPLNARFEGLPEYKLLCDILWSHLGSEALCI